MIKSEQFTGLDSIICSDEVEIADRDGLHENIPAFSGATETVYISTSRPAWKEEDGTVAENCPRNPGFDTVKELGCYACGQSSMSYHNGNTIYS